MGSGADRLVFSCDETNVGVSGTASMIDPRTALHYRDSICWYILQVQGSSDRFVYV
jgi:hypothetical protein